MSIHYLRQRKLVFARQALNALVLGSRAVLVNEQVRQPGLEAVLSQGGGGIAGLARNVLEENDDQLIFDLAVGTAGRKLVLQCFDPEVSELFVSAGALMLGIEPREGNFLLELLFGFPESGERLNLDGLGIRRARIFMEGVETDSGGFHQFSKST